MSSTAAIIGAHIAAAREERGWQQGPLAEALGVGAPALSQWESGASLIPLKRLIQVAGVLDVPLAQLVGGVDRAPGSYGTGFEDGWRACAARAAAATAQVPGTP